MLNLITKNGNSYQISKFSRSFTINEDESLNISASIEISDSVHPMDAFFNTFAADDKSKIDIVKDGVTIVTLENYGISNSYQEVDDNDWRNDNYTISLDKKVITNQDIISEA